MYSDSRDYGASCMLQTFIASLLYYVYKCVVELNRIELIYVYRSHSSPPRNDDHTYLASTPAVSTDELAQPLPFKQDAQNCLAEC